MSPDELRGLRRARGWTQRQLGERCGLSPSSAEARICRLERSLLLHVPEPWADRLKAAFASDAPMPEREPKERKKTERERGPRFEHMRRIGNGR